jgi:hypothetical protein
VLSVYIISENALAAIVVFAEVREGLIVAATEAIAVVVPELARDRRMAERTPGIDVRRKPAIKVSATGIQAIMEAPALNVTELRRRRIPSATVRDRAQDLSPYAWVGRRRWWRNIVAKMREGHVVAAAEAITVVVSKRERDGGVTELSSLLNIRWIVVVKVVVRGFEAIMKALALNVAELWRRRIPATAIMVGAVRVLPVLGREQNWRAQ